MKFIKGFYEDILIVLGLGAIITATFMICVIAGVYVLGAALFGLGAWFAKHPVR